MLFSLRLAAVLGLVTVTSAMVANAQQQSAQPEQEEKPPPPLPNGTVAPDFTGTDINSNPIKLSSLRGKVVVVDFWASWCVPCNAAMAHNQAVMKKLKAEGLPVVMLAVDNSEGRDDFEEWVKKKRAALSALKFVYVSFREDVSSAKFKAGILPRQYVLDKNGVVRASFSGFYGPTNGLEQAVRAILSKHGKIRATVSNVNK